MKNKTTNLSDLASIALDLYDLECEILDADGNIKSDITEEQCKLHRDLLSALCQNGEVAA